MMPQLRSLVWKEWHERKWFLVLGTAWILLGVAYAVGYECMHRLHAPVASFFTTCLVYGLFMAVFLAMRTSLGEVTQGTLGFSTSLPVPRWQLAWVRLGGAVAALAGPIVVGALVMGGRPHPGIRRAGSCGEFRSRLRLDAAPAATPIVRV